MTHLLFFLFCFANFWRNISISEMFLFNVISLVPENTVTSLVF